MTKPQGHTTHSGVIWNMDVTIFAVQYCIDIFNSIKCTALLLRMYSISLWSIMIYIADSLTSSLLASLLTLFATKTDDKHYMKSFFHPLQSCKFLCPDCIMLHYLFGCIRELWKNKKANINLDVCCLCFDVGIVSCCCSIVVFFSTLLCAIQ